MRVWILSGRNDDDDQSDRDDLSNLDVEEETLVDGGEATCDGEEVPGIVQEAETELVDGGKAICDGEEVPGIVQEAETELVDGGKATCDGEEAPGIVQEAGAEFVEVMAVAVDRADFADNVNQCEEGPSHLSADGKDDHEDETEKGISGPADSDYGCVYECVCRHSECVGGTRRSGVGKTRLGASGLACPSAGLLPGPPWLGRLVK